MKARARILVNGIVQGVGYRWFVEDEARRRGLTGYVRNLPDGRVEIVVEGERERIEDLVEWLRLDKPPAAVVERLDVHYEPYRGEFSDFRIRFR